jgi:hypothetical protein
MKNLQRMKPQTLENKLAAFKLILDKPVTIDLPTYRDAINTYEKLVGEYIRRKVKFYEDHI